MNSTRALNISCDENPPWCKEKNDEGIRMCEIEEQNATVVNECEHDKLMATKISNCDLTRVTSVSGVFISISLKRCDICHELNVDIATSLDSSSA